MIPYEIFAINFHTKTHNFFTGKPFTDTIKHTLSVKKTLLVRRFLPDFAACPLLLGGSIGKLAIMAA